MKFIKRKTQMWLIVLFFITINIINVKAAETATITVSSKAGNPGNVVSVDVTVSTPTEMGVYELNVIYNPEILRLILPDTGMVQGGNGVAVIKYFLDMSSAPPKNHTTTLKFELIKPGSSSIAVDKTASFISPIANADDFSLSTTSGTVTVNAPVEASSDNFLSSLEVFAVYEDDSTKVLDLSPSFSKDTLEYALSVEAEVKKLSVIASAADKKARVTIIKDTLETGENTTTVRVTAENGNKRDYIIKTKKALSEQQSTPDIIIDVNGKSANVISDFDNSIVPEGFVTFKSEYKDSPVYMMKNNETGVVLMYVSIEENLSLYIYEDDKIYPFVTFNYNNQTYTILEIPENVSLVSTYRKDRFNINEKSVEAFIYADKEEYYILYAINKNGEKGLYVLDAKENSFQRMLLIDLTKEDVISIEKLEEYKNASKGVVTKDKVEENEDNMYLIIIMTCLIIVLLFAYVATSIKYKKKLSETSKSLDEKTENKDNSSNNSQDSEEGKVDSLNDSKKENFIKEEVFKKEKTFTPKNILVKKDNKIENKKDNLTKKDYPVDKDTDIASAIDNKDDYINIDIFEDDDIFPDYK